MMRALYYILRLGITFLLCICIAVALAISIPLGALVLILLCWRVTEQFTEPPPS